MNKLPSTDFEQGLSFMLDNIRLYEDKKQHDKRAELACNPELNMEIRYIIKESFPDIDFEDRNY